MSFETIAIIQFSDKSDTSTNHSETSSVNKYLVLKEGKTYRFWNYNNNAIGAGFQRDLLDKQFNKTFDIKLSDQIAKKFIERQYEGPNKPPTVVYRIILNEDTFELLNLKVIEKNEFEWLDEITLFSKSDLWDKTQLWILDKAKNAREYEMMDLINPNFISKVEQIIKAKDEGNLVIFVGAGVSKSSGVPLWNELVSELIKDLGITETDYEIVPQLYYQEKKETNYIKKIESILDLERKNPNCIHSEIFKLNPTHIVTTNYDSLLEQENRNQGKNYCVINKDKDLPYSNSAKLIIKMHGDLKEKNIVLKEDDYLQYSDNFKLIEYFVKSIFSSKLVVFIGFSFNDRNLKTIIESVRYILDESYNPALLFIPKPISEIDNMKLNYFDNRGVKVIGYENSIKHYLELVKELPALLRKQNEKDRDFEFREKQYNFLRFIRNYTKEDRFLYTSEGLNILDKMYSGLERFDDLPVIPPKFIVKIKPFAVSDKDPAVYDSYGFHLKTASEEIIRFLSNVDRIENGTIYYSNSSIEENENKNEKLTQVFNWLKSSGVNCIQRKYDFTEKVHNKIRINKQTEKCKCPTCLFDEFHFTHSYQSSMNDNDPENDDFIYLKKARVNFFFSEYEKCYYNLKKGASKAYSNNNYHLYFLHIYNIKQIRFRIENLFVPNHITKKTKDHIINEIESFSVPTIIEELFINQLSKDILHSILQKQLYLDTYIKIKDNQKHIEKLFESHSSGRSYFLGPNYATDIIYSFRVYLHFYRNNHLFDLFYKDHQDLTNIFAKAIFTSIASHESLKQKIHKVELYDLKSIIQYSAPKELFKIIRNVFKQNCTILTLNREDVEDLIELFSNYTNSQFTINDFWGETVEIDSTMNYTMARHMMVRQRFRNHFDNSILVASQLIHQLQANENFNHILENIYKFIIASSNSPFSDAKYFNMLIKSTLKHSPKFDKELVLSACLSDCVWSRKHIKCFAENLGDSEFQIEKKTYNKLISRTSKRKNYKLEIEDLTPLYKYLTKSLREDYKSILNENINLEKTLFDLEEMDLLREQDPNIIEGFFLESLQQKVFLEKDHDIAYLNNKNFWKVYNLYCLKLFKISSSIRTQVEKSEALYYWLIYPIDFDYDNFRHEWLDLLYSEAFFIPHLAKSKKLKKIISTQLKENYNERLSKIYWTHFVKTN